jgi:hypothetical protein
MSKSNLTRRLSTLVHALNSPRGAARLGKRQNGVPSHIAEQMRRGAKAAPIFKNDRATSLTTQETAQ